MVKQVPQSAAQRGRNLAREMFVYRLANWIPALAQLVPQSFEINERHGFLVFESLTHASAWPDPAATPSVTSGDFCHELGKAMGAWHSATLDLSAWPSLGAGILSLADSLDVAQSNRPPSTQTLMASIVADTSLAGALRQGQSAYRHRVLIHGDLRRENWMLDRRNGKPRLKIIDWEMSGTGDPAWDIGSVLAEGVLEQIRDNGLRCAPEAIWSPTIEVSMRRFFEGYLSSSCIIDVHEAKTWEMISLCAAGRLLHVACECADLAADANSWPIPEIVSRARRFVTDHRKVAGKLQHSISHA